LTISQYLPSNIGMMQASIARSRRVLHRPAAAAGRASGPPAAFLWRSRILHSDLTIYKRVVSNQTMEDERRSVLERVARGELSPAEGAALLDQMESRSSGAASATADDPRDWAADWSRDPAWGRPEAPPPSAEGRAARIRVAGRLGNVEILGDPSVTEAMAEGPHVARRDGDTLVVESPVDGLDMAGFSFVFGGPHGSRRGRYRHHHGWRGGFPLRVRVNPELPLEIEAQAGQVRVRGVHGPIRGNVQAGSTDIVDFRSPLDISVQAGSLNARGVLDTGVSRVRCEAGSVRIRLERGSSVRVSARNTMGKVVFDDGDPRQPWVVGAGQGTLDIDATMGAVRVSAE
jgi:hypothetical protein